MRPIKHYQLSVSEIKESGTKKFKDSHMTFLKYNKGFCFIQTPELEVKSIPRVYNGQYTMDLYIKSKPFHKTLARVNKRVIEIVAGSPENYDQVEHMFWNPIHASDDPEESPFLRCRMSTRKGAQPNFRIYQRVNGKYEEKQVDDVSEGDQVTLILRLHGILIRKSFFTVVWKIDQLRMAAKKEKELNEFEVMDFMSNINVELEDNCIIDESDVEVCDREAHDCVYEGE